ncbi:PKD domain-containing protein [Pontibacter sp. G13]|uniref:PKD domain-containing protein n=1 Tax=Pontibacter sp. G13 TaxID=3074898 RepID=UPI00288BBAC8|nr:PKD domain-containing protein [Pontibacter sp. G13]WNJ21447.1 PKD domain-containing protein [Pontibacter sp. G13]
MMKRFGILIFFALLSASFHLAVATHIVGAELYYECVGTDANGNHIYDVELKLYRDCLNGDAQYDPFISLYVFEGATGNVHQTISVPVPALTPQIQPSDWGPCVAMIPQICVEEGIYATTLTLPPIPGGYNIAWSRCCRNGAISNLIQPLNQGISFLARIPGSDEVTACNSMPTFDQVPSIFLCVNQPYSFNHSATDPDGDSLAYALTDPYTGTNFQGLGTGNPQFGGNDPQINPTTNPMGPPPYNNVNFAPGYNFLDPYGSGNFTMDPMTGFLTVTPTQTGIFVYSISVFEYRNGVLLSENRRDFQIHVINCLPQSAPAAITHDLTGNNFLGDTIFVEAGQPFCYDVQITDPDVAGNLIPYTVSAQFGNGPTLPPLATFNFTGINPIDGTICWEPGCVYDGQLVPLVVGAFNDGDCENVSNVFDTVWIKVTVPPNQPPVITPDLSGLNVSNDTIFISATDTLCVPFIATDPNLGDSLGVNPISAIFNDPNNPASISITSVTDNPISGEICWTPTCDDEGAIIPFTVGATDYSLCNVTIGAAATMYVVVEVPPNDPPSVTTDLSGNIFSNDTLFVTALEPFCFDFTATDPDVDDVLTFFSGGGIFAGPNPPVVTTNGTNPLTGTICWTPSCVYSGQTLTVPIGVADQGVCSNIGQGFDTIYIVVNEPPNVPPVLTTQLNGTNFSNDTVFVNALDNMCFSFSALDGNTGDTLSMTALSPIFTNPDGPSFTWTGVNPVGGQICWEPDCQFAGQVFPLIYEVSDNGACGNILSDRDTIWVQVDLPPNTPPTINHIFGGLNTSGDTIFANAQEQFCYNLTFADANATDTLTAYSVSPIFNDPDGPTFTWLGTNPLQGQVCWTPSCDAEGQVFEFVIGVDDDGDCGNILSDLDTVIIKVNDPLSLPPVITHDLSGLATSGDTVFLEVGDSACYNFVIRDLTTENGVDYLYNFENVFGGNLGLVKLDVDQVGDSLVGTVCFFADCSNGGSYYRSIVTGIDKQTCPPFEQAFDTVYFKVNTEFMSYAGRDTFFCEGSGGVQLSSYPIGGESPYYYQWYCSNPGNCGFTNGNDNVANPVVNPTDTTTYFVQITDKNGCTSEIDDVQVNVKRLPVVDAGPDTGFCAGAPGVQLLCQVLNPIEAPGPYTYTWLPSEGLNNPNVNNPFASPDTTTIYTVIVGSANGCVSDNTTLDTLSTVTVSVKPIPSAHAGPDFDICLGEETQLLGFATDAGPTYEYAWTPSTGLNDSSLQTPFVSPDKSTTYFLVVWSRGCRSVADSATVIVHTLPTLDPTVNYEVCAGDSVQMEVLAGGDPLATFYDYQWLPNTGLNNAQISNPMAGPLASIDYEVFAVSNFGCVSDTATIPLTVNPTPVVEAGADTFLCRGEILQLNASHTVLGGATTQPVFYEWSPAVELSNAFISDPTTSATQTIVYTVSTASGSCVTEDQIKVDVFEPVVADAFADTSRACQGDSVQLFAMGGNGNATFTWIPSNGLNDPESEMPLAAPDVTTLYSVIISEGVCADTAQVELAINPGPISRVYASDQLGCAPFTVQFDENAENALAYIWDFGDGSEISNEARPLHVFDDPGTYQVNLTVVGQGGCTDASQPLTIEVIEQGEAYFLVGSDGETTPLLTNEEIRFLDQSTRAVKWFWDFGDGNLSNEQNPTHVYREPGSYAVSLTIEDAAGCLDTYVFAPLVVKSPEIFIPNVFSPNGDGIQDDYRVTYTGTNDFTLTIFDRWGKKVFGEVYSPTDTWNGKNGQGNDLPEGVYYYVVTVGEQFFRGDLTLLR